MGGAVDIWYGIFPYILLIVLFYFVFIVPQKRREKQFGEMIAGLKEGDNVITVGGIIGKITFIGEDDISIETGLEKTKIKLAKWAVKNVVKESTN